MNIKSKLTGGLVFLFVLILLFGILSIYYINRLSNDANVILKNNHESLVYCNQLLRTLDQLAADTSRKQLFDQYLLKQERNITEPGEERSTLRLRKAFDLYLERPDDSTQLEEMRQAIYDIETLNQQAILRKNQVALDTAEDAKIWLSLIFTTLALIALSFVVNFPDVISRPIRVLSEGIREIANKNYDKRIHLDRQDEFGALANTFNSMAEKLHEYENSNLARISFEKRRIETIINQMRDGIIGLDAGRNILFLNAIAEKMLGLKQADIIGRYAADIALANDLLRNLLQPSNGKELKIYTEGRENYYSKDMLEVKNGEELIGEVIVLRNVTPFHELNEAKTNFLATVSHELKTPIAAIKMSTKLLQDARVGALNPEQEELVGNIKGDTDRLLNITSELLNMAQVETGKIQLRLQSQALTPIVETALKAVRSLAQQKSLALVYVPQYAGKVLADGDKTTWVLINLLNNAIRFAPEGTAINIEEKVVAGQAQVSIRDLGKGIEPEFQDRIFDRYFKVPGEEKSGTGLGLAISREFMEAQQGNIGVVSTPGKETIFFIQLPLCEPS
jgi:PAS domain S-box-containing protein